MDSGVGPASPANELYEQLKDQTAKVSKTTLRSMLVDFMPFISLLLTFFDFS